MRKLCMSQHFTGAYDRRDDTFLVNVDVDTTVSLSLYKFASRQADEFTFGPPPPFLHLEIRC